MALDSKDTTPDLKAEEHRIEYAQASEFIEEPKSGLATLDAGATNVLVELPPGEERRILRKIDYRLIPLLGFLYLVAFVDRSNSKPHTFHPEHHPLQASILFRWLTCL